MHSEDATSAAADAEYRRRSTANWESAAAGWISERERMRERVKPVTQWLVDHLELRPGDTVTAAFKSTALRAIPLSAGRTHRV